MKTGEASADRSKLWDLNFTPPLSFKNPEEANIKSAKAEDSSSISDETFVNPAVKMTFKSERKLCRSARDLSKGIYKDDSGTSNSSVFNAVDINITNDDITKYLECEASSSSTKPIVSKSSSILSNLLGFSMDKPRLKTCITHQYFPPKIPLDSVIPSVSASSEREFSEANWADARLKLPPPPPPPQKQVKKSRRGPRSRSSQYRGVTFYKRTGRWESHIWDCGKQVYLGGFDTADIAARTYDRAAIKFRGPDADINFNLSDYDEDLKEMSSLTKADMVHILRRQANGFSRGSYRYNCAAINCNGKEAVTNFNASIHSEPKNRSVEQNLDLSLSLSLPIGSGTLILEDNKKMPVPKMKSNINTFAQFGRKKARHINKMLPNLEYGGVKEETGSEFPSPLPWSKEGWDWKLYNTGSLNSLFTATSRSSPQTEICHPSDWMQRSTTRAPLSATKPSQAQNLHMGIYKDVDFGDRFLG